MQRLRSRRPIRRSRQSEPRLTESAAAQAQNLEPTNADVNKTRLDLLTKICSNVRSIKQQLPVISSITQMIRYALNASATSVLLIDVEKEGLLNKYADGPLGKQFKQLYLKNQVGITRWVLQNGKPMLIKHIGKDDNLFETKDEITGLVPRSVIYAPLISRGKIIGAIEVLNKLDGNSFNERDMEILNRLATDATLTIENIRLNETVLYSYKDTVQQLVSMLDYRETAASKSSKRVLEYALVAATALSFSAEDKQNMEIGAILHDIGLLTIPVSILNKRENLTEQEWNLIRKHPVIGYNLLRGIPSLNQASKLILYHHERWDGKGYPCGLKGETIPIGARVIAVADAFESMTVKHAYRAAMSSQDAVTELGRCAGSQFCPTVVKAFMVSYTKSHFQGRVKVTSSTS